MNGKRKDGRLQKGFRVNGKLYIVYGRNAKELFEAERAKREQIEKGISKRNNPTFAQYFEKWTDARRESVKECTIRSQTKIYGVISGIVITDAARTFGEMKLKEITIDDLRTVQTELARTRKTRTVNDYMALVSHIMSDAQKERVIEYNPCCLLNNLKRKEETARDTGHRALTIDETKAFFESPRCRQSAYYNVFRFALYTGMRAGEIGALRYSDIRKDVITVERTVTRTESGSYTIGESTKTAAGRRMIPINESIKCVLSAQKELNAALYGGALQINDTIFKASEGGVLVATPVDREIKKVCAAAGIEPFTMHAFRATFATRAIESGMNPKTLQELLGHSNFNITMSLYGHCMLETKKEAMNNLIQII